MTPALTELVVADPAESWIAGGFAVHDDTVQVGSVAIRLVGREGGRGITAWGFVGWTGGEIDGVATHDAPTPAATPMVHPNGATAIDHAVILSPHLHRTVEVMQSHGFDVRRTRDTESYGSPMRQVFFRSGEVIIELIGPPEPSGDGPAVFFGIALTVANLHSTVALLGDACGSPKDAVQDGRRIATLRHKTVDMSVATAFMSPHPGR